MPTLFSHFTLTPIKYNIQTKHLLMNLKAPTNLLLRSNTGIFYFTMKAMQVLDKDGLLTTEILVG